MKTKQDIEKQFREDFQALINKYKASIDICDEGYCYESDIQCTVYISPEYDNFECVSEGCSFKLGNYHSEELE